MPSQLRTPICDLLGIDVPIMQAGMGNVAYGRMAAAVSNAGGLGSIGGIDIPPEELDQEIKLFRTLSERPLCVDLGFPSRRSRASQPVGVGHRRRACRGEQGKAVGHTPVHRPQGGLQVAVHVNVWHVAQQPKCPAGAVSGSNGGRQQDPVANVAHGRDRQRKQPESGVRIAGGEPGAEQ